MKRRQQDSNLRATRCRRRASNALPCQLGHASVRASRRAPCGDARRATSGALSSDDLSGGRRAADSPGRRASAPAHTRKCAAARARRRPAPPSEGARPVVASGRRGSRTPKACQPTRFRDGIPRRWQSFRGSPASLAAFGGAGLRPANQSAANGARLAPASVEPATLRLRGGSSAG